MDDKIRSTFTPSAGKIVVPEMPMNERFTPEKRAEIVREMKEYVSATIARQYAKDISSDTYEKDLHHMRNAISDMDDRLEKKRHLRTSKTITKCGEKIPGS